MPLFECEQCHTVENTGCCNFWEAHMENKPKLCSECDPEIGKWHGLFTKSNVNDYRRTHPESAIRYPAEKANA